MVSAQNLFIPLIFEFVDLSSGVPIFTEVTSGYHY